MNDMAACTNDNCKRRLNCKRWWLGTRKDPLQRYGEFNEKNCKFFIGNETDYIRHQMASR